MALSVNRELGAARQSNLFSPQSVGIVKEDELTKVAREILSATPKKINLGESYYSRINTNTSADLKIFSPGADINVVKQTATNLTGYNVTISQDAANAINTLKAQAAQSQIKNLTKIVDGKIHINSEKADTAETKSIFTSNEYKNVEVFHTSNLYKDKKGSGGLYIPFEDNKDDNNKGLDLTI